VQLPTVGTTSVSDQPARRWLAVFLRRFFGNQFKRSCLPDGPKVGSISLSPRGDRRMPGDAARRGWTH
jgi:NAD+ synthase (glutamine-hydrolysing)